METLAGAPDQDSFRKREGDEAVLTFLRETKVSQMVVLSGGGRVEDPVTAEGGAGPP